MVKFIISFQFHKKINMKYHRDEFDGYRIETRNLYELNRVGQFTLFQTVHYSNPFHESINSVAIANNLVIFLSSCKYRN